MLQEQGDEKIMVDVTRSKSWHIFYFFPLTYGFQQSSYEATAFIVRLIQGFHKRTVGCWTTIIQGSCCAKQWRWLHWIPSLKRFFFRTTDVATSCSLKVTTSLSICRWCRCMLLIMFKDEKKAQCVLWFAETNRYLCSAKFRNKLRTKPPHLNLRRRFERIKETGSVLYEKVIRKTCSFTETPFFYSGRHIKNTVYTEEIRDLRHMNDRICTDIETVTPELLSRVWEEDKHRLDIIYGDKLCPYWALLNAIQPKWNYFVFLVI
jgi:hypothetical protein